MFLFKLYQTAIVITIIFLFQCLNASAKTNEHFDTKNRQTYANQISSMEGLQQRSTKLDEIGNFVIQYSAHIAIWRSGEHSGVNTTKHIRIWERQADGRLKARALASAYDQ